MAMATTSVGSTPLRPFHLASPLRRTPSLSVRACTMFRRSVEENYNVRVERGVKKERLKELGVLKWSTWKTGKCRVPWDWQVDQEVFIVSGEVRVVPHGAKSGDRYMQFKAGDLVRYPKWLEADMFFNGPYEERYRFRAYGDDN
ncbi:uncharacterized protein LOC144543590 [Carex rostrata]